MVYFTLIPMGLVSDTPDDEKYALRTAAHQMSIKSLEPLSLNVNLTGTDSSHPRLLPSSTYRK
jgi:hypothetical protein